MTKDADTRVLDAVHAIEKESLSVCENPICRNEYKPTCLPWSTQRFCCDQCKQSASIINRVAKLYGLSVEKVHEFLSARPRSA
jgi:hypothetical protein